MYLYTHRLISFFEALCLLINYHIRAVLFSNSVFSHFLVVMYSESLQGSYTSTGLLTLQILLEYTMHQGQKYQLNWREQRGLQHHPRRETQDEHRIIWIFFQLAEETTCHIFSWQKSVQLHWLLTDWLWASSAAPGDVIPYMANENGHKSACHTTQTLSSSHTVTKYTKTPSGTRRTGAGANSLLVKPRHRDPFLPLDWIMESLQLQGIFKGHLVQPPCNEQGHLQLDQVSQSNQGPWMLSGRGYLPPLWHNCSCVSVPWWQKTSSLNVT